MKKYCKNCKYKVYYGLWCKNPNIQEQKRKQLIELYGGTFEGNEFAGESIPSSIKDPSINTWDVNKEGICPHYKPKWYRRLLK